MVKSLVKDEYVEAQEIYDGPKLNLTEKFEGDFKLYFEEGDSDDEYLEEWNKEHHDPDLDVWHCFYEDLP